MPETVAEILKAYQTGDATPADIVARSFARLRAHDDPALFISLRGEKDVIAEAQALARGGDKSLPLYGIPVAVKDNIDVAGLPTSAVCPAFLYSPGKDAARGDCGLARRARSLSAKPILISLRPGLSACARRMASAAICSTTS